MTAGPAKASREAVAPVHDQVAAPMFVGAVDVHKNDGRAFIHIECKVIRHSRVLGRRQRLESFCQGPLGVLR